MRFSKTLSFILILLLFLNCPVTLACLITDDFAEATLDKNLKIKEYEMLLIEDDLINETATKEISDTASVEPVKAIEDNFANNTLNPNLKIPHLTEAPIEDTLAKELTRNLAKDIDKNLKPKTNIIQTVNISDDTNTAIKIAPAKYYSTKQRLQEGSYIDFIALENVEIDGTPIKKGDIIQGRIENVSQNGAYGAPADLVVSNFKFNNNLNDVLIEGTIEKKGADRAIWVYPSAYMLIWFFGAGLLFLSIRGGHAKLKPNQVYVIGE